MKQNYQTFICCIFPKNQDVEYELFLNELKNNRYFVNNIWVDVNWKPPIEYIEEMGDSLITNIIILKDNKTLDEIVELKRYLMFVEKNTAHDNGNRKLNLNPGYLSDKGMFLLTHKPNDNRGREKIADDIWQEKQYDYNEEFVINTNTFSEFNDQKRLSLFNRFYAKINLCHI